jgi:hypothetical protein
MRVLASPLPGEYPDAGALPGAVMIVLERETLVREYLFPALAIYTRESWFWEWAFLPATHLD